MLLAVVAAVLGSPSPAVPTTLLVGGEQYQWPFGSTPQLRSEDLNQSTRHAYTQAASCEISAGGESAACNVATAAVTSGA